MWNYGVGSGLLSSAERTCKYTHTECVLMFCVEQQKMCLFSTWRHSLFSGAFDRLF